MSHADKRANLQSRQQSRIIVDCHPQPRGFTGFPFCIRYNLSGVVNRRMIGDDKMTLATFLILTFLVVEPRRYEHAGCSTKRSTALLKVFVDCSPRDLLISLTYPRSRRRQFFVSSRRVPRASRNARGESSSGSCRNRSWADPFLKTRCAWEVYKSRGFAGRKQPDRRR